MRYLPAIFALTLAACAHLEHPATKSAEDSKTVTLNDGSNIRVPPRFVLEERIGDNPVVFGKIRDSDTLKEIEYRSGSVFGMPYDYADFYNRKEAGDTILKHSKGISHGLHYNLSITRNQSGDEILYISFPKPNYTCFFTKVNSPSDIQAMKRIILTFRQK